MVLSGGGAFGAYGIGVMKALFSGQSPSTELSRINPTIFTGTSVGSLNASLMVADPDDDAAVSLRSLQQFWFRELVGRRRSGRRELFRLRGDPASFIQPQRILMQPVDTFLQYGRDAAYFSFDFLRRLGALPAWMHLSSSVLSIWPV